MIRDLDRLFFGSDVFDIFNTMASSSAKYWDSPSVTLTPESDRYVIKAVTPGFAEEELSVDIKGREISISGKQEQTDDGNLHRTSYRSFEKKAILPHDAIMDDVTAEYKNGILAVSIARKAIPALERKRIPIKALGPAT